MRHNILLTLCVIFSLLMALPSMAQEILGLYFDAEGTQTRFTTSTPMEMVPVYLVLHNPYFEDPITGWECAISTAGAVALMPMEIAGDGVNQHSSPIFHVEYTTPLPPAEVTVLATGELMVMEPELAGQVFINTLPGINPNYLSVAYDHDWTRVDTPAECETSPVAWVNDDGQIFEPSFYTVPSVLHFEGEDLEPVTIHNTGSTPMTVHVSSSNGLKFGLGNEGWNYGIRIQIPPRNRFSFWARHVGDASLSTSMTVSTCSGLSSTIPAYPGPSQVLSVNPAEQDFGIVLFPQNDPVTREFYVENGGTNAFSFEVIQCDDFEIQIDQGVLGPGDYRMGTVTLDPSESGDHSCDVTFTNSDDQQETVFHCFGSAGEYCDLNTDHLDFQQVGIGFPFTQYLSVTNYSPEVLDGFASLALPDNGFSITGGEGAFSLLTGQSHEVAVTFDPANPGLVTNWLDLGTDCDQAEVTGTGVEAIPELTASSPFIEFSPVYMGYSGSRVLTISNDGPLSYEGNFQIAGACFSSPDTGLFSLPAGAGASKDFTVEFTPPGIQHFGGGVLLNPHTGLQISFIGEGLGQVPTYSLDPPELHFGYITADEPMTRSIVIHNNGPERLVGHAVEISTMETPFSVVDATAVFDILPGQDQTVDVFFPGDFGDHGTFLDLGIPQSDTYLVSAVSREGENQAEIGVYFDYGVFSENQINAPAGTIVEAYVVARNPESFSGWEGCLEILGDNPILYYYQIQGYFNYLEAPCFKVINSLGNTIQSGSPLVRIGFEIACDDCYTKIRLFPVQEPPIAGSMALYKNFHIPETLVRAPYHAATSTGTPLVATINSPVVSVGLPRPMASTNGGSVHLQWNLGGDYDACHVYRRLGEEPTERLTDTPIPLLDGRVEFQDQPPVIPGTGAYYSYGAIRDGQEVGMSPETMINLDQLLPKVTALTGNYPNPFNPKTTLQFDLAEPSEVVLQIYDLSGRRIRTLVREEMPAGSHEQIWLGRDDQGRAVPSGVYFARLQAGFNVMMRKIALLK